MLIATILDIEVKPDFVEVTAICPHDGLVTIGKITRLPDRDMTCEHCGLGFLLEKQKSED